MSFYYLIDYNKPIKLTRKGALEVMTDIIKLEDLTKAYIYSELKNNYKEFEDINILNNVYFQGPHRYSDVHGIADAQYSGSDVHAVDY